MSVEQTQSKGQIPSVGSGELVSLDTDGFPPCTMTLEELHQHLKENFHGDFRVVAFRVRTYDGKCTLTLSRGTMEGKRVNKVQADAVKASLKANKPSGEPPTGRL